MNTIRKTSKQIVIEYVIAIGPGGSPSSHVWMLVDPQMTNVQEHQVIVEILTKQGIITNTGHFLRLTDIGLNYHKKIIEALGAPTGNPGSPGEQVSCYDNCKKENNS